MGLEVEMKGSTYDWTGVRQGGVNVTHISGSAISGSDLICLAAIIS